MTATPTVDGPTLDQLEAELMGHEAAIARHRARQLELLRTLEGRSVAALDGARTFTEWTAARLDVTADTAKQLVRTAFGSEDTLVEAALGSGEVSFDRAVATAALAAAGADEATVADSYGLDLAGVRRVTGRHRRLTSENERRSHADRYLVLQPSLDQSHWRLHGTLPGYDGALVAAAVNERGDRLHSHPDGERATRPQRSADALVAMAQDSLDRRDDDTDSGGERSPVISVFVDAELAAASGGEAGIEVATGPRLGPATLEMLLCEGRVEINTTGAHPLGIGHTSRVIPPRLRRLVLHRDGGCVADGCHSRYRLQAHHRIPVSQGGATDAANLITLCWYHHHVVVHGRQRRIDPASPSRRIRFLRPTPARAPP